MTEKSDETLSSSTLLPSRKLCSARMARVGIPEISDDVDIGSYEDRVARGGSPFTKSNIRVIYHLAVANAAGEGRCA